MKVEQYFRYINDPVILFEAKAPGKILYENRSALKLLNPIETNGSWEAVQQELTFNRLFCASKKEQEEFWRILSVTDQIPLMDTEITLYSGEKVYVTFCASRIQDGGMELIQVNIVDIFRPKDGGQAASALELVFNAVNRSPSTQQAINRVLEAAGECVGANRVYVFEAVSPTLTSNTYEWCAEGIEPAIDRLQNLPKEEYSYDKITEQGIYIVDDIRKLPESDRVILEPQGIKALAIVPIVSTEGPLGYVGFDDTAKYRIWSQSEVHLLESLASVLSFLLIRKNAEQRLKNSWEVLNAVTSSIDSDIVVSDICTGEILFINEAHIYAAVSEADIRSLTHLELLKQYHRDKRFKNALPIMVDEKGRVLRDSYSFEYQSPATGKWYLIHDMIIKWIDGKNVLIETATEITTQKNHEAELEMVAFTDSMTGTYNREWGRQALAQIIEKPNELQDHTLVFIDLDGLKKTNDTFGHGAGDQMIIRTIEIIRSCIRKSDILARWGGDEFLLILQANEQQSQMVMEKVMTAVEQSNAAGKQPYPLGFSYGIVQILREKHRNVEMLINEADKKMYKNKAAKRGLLVK